MAPQRPWLRVAALLLACSLSCSRRTAPELPVLDSMKFLPAVRMEVENAFDAARSQPNDAAAAGKLGMLLDAHEQYEAAAQCYARAQHLDSRAFDWPYHLGCVRTMQGRHQEAASSFQSALRIREYTPALLKLGDSLLATGKPAESAREYQKVIEREPANAAAWCGLGRIKQSERDLVKAAEYYERACQLFPSYGTAHYALALIYRSQGRSVLADVHSQQAEQHKTTVPNLSDPLRAAVQNLSGGPNAHIRRAAALEQAGRIEDAINEHLAALRLDPNLVQAHINLISLFGRAGQVEQAEEHYRAATKLTLGQADADYNYGVLLFALERVPEAERAFRRALKAQPDHAQAHHNLGYLFERQGKLSAALTEYRAALRSQPDYRLAHFHAGRILATQRQYGDAIEHLLRTVQVEDDSTPGYLYALSATYARAGQMQNAISCARRARDQAAARSQAELVASIEKDLRRMQQREGRQ